MQFTAKQLRAIENAVGRDAEVEVMLDGGPMLNRYYSETVIRVTANHDNRRVVSHISISPYAGDLPFRVLAEKLVMDINHYIMRESFAEAFKR